MLDMYNCKCRWCDARWLGERSLELNSAHQHALNVRSQSHDEEFFGQRQRIRAFKFFLVKCQTHLCLTLHEIEQTVENRFERTSE